MLHPFCGSLPGGLWLTFRAFSAKNIEPDPYLTRVDNQCAAQPQVRAESCLFEQLSLRCGQRILSPFDMTAHAVVFVRPETFGRRALEQQIRLATSQEYRRARNNNVTVFRNTLVRLGHEVFLQFLECYNFLRILTYDAASTRSDSFSSISKDTLIAIEPCKSIGGKDVTI